MYICPADPVIMKGDSNGRVERRRQEIVHILRGMEWLL